MSAITNSLLAVSLVSLTTLIGIFTLFFTKKFLDKTISVLIAVSIGALLGTALLDLLPESIELLEANQVFNYLLIGILAFFLTERFLFWYHCHNGKCDSHKVLPFMILLGDAIHTFIDGVVVAAAFIVDISLGWVTTFAIIMHELPHELSDFFVLIYGGFSRAKAILWNLAVALAHFIGVFAAFFLYIRSETTIAYLIPLAAGGFIYIAVADLMPELHKETSIKKALTQLALILLGIFLTSNLIELI